jgi:hypothetical protein
VTSLQHSPGAADESAGESFETPASARSLDNVSPELALVDQALGDRERSSLPQTDDTLGRLELLVRAHRIAVARDQPVSTRARRSSHDALDGHVTRNDVADGAPAARASAEDGAKDARGIEQPRVRRRRFRVASRVVFIAAVAAGAATVGSWLLASTRDGSSQADDMRTAALAGSARPSTSSDIATLGKPSRPPVRKGAGSPLQRHESKTRKSTAKPRTRATTRRPDTRRVRSSAAPAGKLESSGRLLAWPPTPRATGYRVELYRGPTRVFSANARTSRVLIPLASTSGSPRRGLTHGEYRCYVWAVVNGRLTRDVVLQAKVVL